MSTNIRSVLNSDEWQDLGRVRPEEAQACEYTIVVKIKGWYHPEDDVRQFVPCDREPPVVKLTSWRPWKGAPTIEEGIRLNDEFRRSKLEERNLRGASVDNERLVLCD